MRPLLLASAAVAAFVPVLASADASDNSLTVAFAREMDWYRALVDEILGSLGEDAKRVVLHALGALQSSDAESRATAA